MYNEMHLCVSIKIYYQASRLSYSPDREGIRKEQLNILISKYSLFFTVYMQTHNSTQYLKPQSMLQSSSSGMTPQPQRTLSLMSPYENKSQTKLIQMKEHQLPGVQTLRSF